MVMILVYMTLIITSFGVVGAGSDVLASGETAILEPTGLRERLMAGSQLAGGLTQPNPWPSVAICWMEGSWSSS